MGGAKLLIVEDDERARTALRLALEDEGYDVDESRGVEDALRALARRPPDIMMMDLMLSGVDGVGCIRAVRRAHDLPIIVLSAFSESHDVVASLEAGADDYVSKPFVVKEVTARLRALRRRTRMRCRSRGVRDVVLEADPREPLVLSPASATVRRGDRDLYLTLTEYRLLCALASMPGRVLSRRALLERVWDPGFLGDDRIIDVHIRRLRTKIERDPAQPRAVVTVRGFGYRLDIRARPDDRTHHG